MEKTAEINLFLFGKPEWEFEGKVNPETIKSKGDELKSRMYEIADSLQKLCDNGWEYDVGLYDLMLFKNTSKTEAERELAKLGIDAEVLELEDWND
ncbi:MAG: hypothetical protein ABIH20_05800 [Candidatus Diapherotrites archaeon]